MRVTVLMEDTQENGSCIAEHGLSLFIETQGRAFLMDTGATEKTWENAEKLGIDRSLLKRPELVWLDGSAKIDDDVYVLAGVKGRRCWPKGNMTLKIRRNGEILQDTFDHEQSLVITENGKRFLFSGCAHNGILNILDAFRRELGGEPDCVFTGFHMMKKTPLDEEEIRDVLETANELMKTDTVYYSGHCTGEEAFGILKERMGKRLHRMRSGLQIEL